MKKRKNTDNGDNGDNGDNDKFDQYYDDEEDSDYEEEDFDEDDDDCDNIVNEEDGLGDVDIDFLNKIRKPKSPLHPLYKKFLKCKEIISNRDISLYDILSCNITDDKRANLLEKLECLRQIEPHTSDYIEARDTLRNLYVKYAIIDITIPPIPSPIHIPVSKNAVVSQNDLESTLFKRKIKELVCTESNRKTLEEKLDEFEESMKGEEKNKLKRWLTAALNLPFDKISKHVNANNANNANNGNTSSSSSSSSNKKSKKKDEEKQEEKKEETEENKITEKIKSASQYLDKKLYGMKNVKERLLLFLNKKLREGNSRGCNIALLGKPGVGKCLHPDTEIIMNDLTRKKAKDIVKGDVLLGDDQTPRIVLSTVKGKEEMFTVQQEFGETYCVNKSHILTLRRLSDNKIVDIPLVDVLGKEAEYTPTSAGYFGNKTEDLCEVMGKNMALPMSKTKINPFISKDYLSWTLLSKLKFLYSLIDASEITKSEDNKTSIYIPTDRVRYTPIILDVIRSIGMRCVYQSPFLVINHDKVEEFSIHSQGEGDYCGFTLDGNERFVLADWTITHNTAIAKCLAECLDLPFAQVSFGGVTHPDFLMGHDYTYVGSRPGEISRCLSRMGSKNGILFFDEFDKATDKKDIMSTLLHITDFSQNSEFRDNYFPELTQDLGKLWFIYSMNQVPNDPALLDRLEIIQVDEYTVEERKAICTNYLFPKYLKEMKIEDKVIVCQDAVKRIIEIANGSRDRKGVRDLERCINLIIEKIYFYIHNKDEKQYEEEYPWYKKMTYKEGKVVISKQLCDTILSNCKKEEVYVNMYM